MSQRKKQKRGQNGHDELRPDQRGYIRIPTVAGFYNSIGHSQPAKQAGQPGLLLRVARTSPSAHRPLVITDRNRNVVAKVKLHTRGLMDLAMAAYRSLPEHSQKSLRKSLRK